MKKILLLVILNIPLLLVSQNTPDFITELFFEDAIGNKDTLWVGYDRETDYGKVDFELGEDTILFGTPFDSVFEARAYAKEKIGENHYYGTTNILKSSDCGTHKFESLLQLSIKIKYPPLKVSWNKSLWAEEYCRGGSFIQSHLLGPLLGWYDDIVYFANQDSVIFTSEEMVRYTHNDSTNMHVDSTIRDMHLQIKSGRVATRDIYIGSKFLLYPNPARSHLTIELPNDIQGKEINFFDISGRIVYEKRLEQNDQKIELNVQHFPKGIYTCSIIFETGEVVSQKWVKLE